MKLISKIKTIASNRAMGSAYLQWFGSKLVSGKPPRITLPGGGGQLGEWLSFSEYWSFQNIISEPERLLVERCLAGCARSKATAFDIGANVGAFTCLAASLGYRVHSFEPIPETFCRLKNNVKFNGLLGSAQLNCLAVGKDQGLVTFHVKENAAAINRMALPGMVLPDSATSTQLVAVSSLDAYCSAESIDRIDFLKLDVEGMEPFVLQGAKRLFIERRIAAVLIEICPGNLRAVGLSPGDLYHEFETIRYSPYVLTADGRPGAKLSLAEIAAIPLGNVVLLPDA